MGSPCSAPFVVAAMLATSALPPRAAVPQVEPPVSGLERDASLTARTQPALLLGRRSARSVVLDDVAGSGGDARARSALRSALAAHLARRGFSLVGADGGWTLKPAVLAVDVRDGGGALTVEVKASVMAIDGEGHVAAMVEGRARARAAGAPPASAAPITAKALDAAAASICEDLARRLGA
jgi:hypothetical protein